MLQTAIEAWVVGPLDFLFIENAGNSVCPSNYDLGEQFRFVLLSTAEGEDKPLKYPPSSTVPTPPSPRWVSHRQPCSILLPPPATSKGSSPVCRSSHLLQNRRRRGDRNRLLPQPAFKFTSGLYRRQKTPPAYFHHTATNHANRTSFASGGLTTNLVRITLRVNLRRAFAPCKVRAKDWERNATGIHHHAA